MPEVSPSGDRVRFGVFELDLRSGELRKAGGRVGLQEQALQVLTTLLERPGDLVTREELRQRFSDFGRLPTDNKSGRRIVQLAVRLLF